MDQACSSVETREEREFQNLVSLVLCISQDPTQKTITSQMLRMLFYKLCN